MHESTKLKFITVFTRTRHQTLPWATRMQRTPCICTIPFNIILPSTNTSPPVQQVFCSYSVLRPQAHLSLSAECVSELRNLKTTAWCSLLHCSTSGCSLCLCICTTRMSILWAECVVIPRPWPVTLDSAKWTLDFTFWNAFIFWGGGGGPCWDFFNQKDIRSDLVASWMYFWTSQPFTHD